MKNILRGLSLFLFVILFFGCDSDNKQQTEEFKKEISKRQNNNISIKEG